MVFLDELDRINAACNTGPLISAFQCAGTELLKRYVAQLYVTPAELMELERHGWKREIEVLVRDGFAVVASGLSGVEKDQAASLARRIATHQLSGNPILPTICLKQRCWSLPYGPNSTAGSFCSMRKQRALLRWKSGCG